LAVENVRISFDVDVDEWNRTYGTTYSPKLVCALAKRDMLEYLRDNPWAFEVKAD
jgi:hypothetical protein